MNERTNVNEEEKTKMCNRKKYSYRVIRRSHRSRESSSRFFIISFLAFIHPQHKDEWADGRQLGNNNIIYRVSSECSHRVNWKISLDCAGYGKEKKQARCFVSVYQPTSNHHQPPTHPPSLPELRIYAQKIEGKLPSVVGKWRRLNPVLSPPYPLLFSGELNNFRAWK